MRKDLKRTNDFIENYTKIQEFMNNEVDFNLDYLYFDKYLSDNKNIENKICEYLNKNGEQSLIQAPTAAGKTYTILSDVFRNVKFDDDKQHILIMTVPNKSQAEQISKKYNAHCLVGNMGINILDLDFNKSNIVVAVYEKTEDVKYLLNRKNTIVNMVIDESHNLTSSSNFRVECIKKLSETKDLILSKNGSVILLTATPENLMMHKFDNILFCLKNDEYRASTNKFNLYINKNEDLDVNNILYKEIDKGIIRYNNISSYKDLINYYQTKTDKKVLFANSKEKSYIRINDKIKYNNEVIDKIINKEVLPENDITFITSLADAGINIVDIENTNKEDYSSYFVAQDARNFDLLNIEQFFNRLRFICKSYNLIINNSQENVSEFKDLTTIFEEEYKKLNKQLEYLNKLKDLVSFEFDNFNTDNNISIAERKEKIKNKLNYILNFKDADGYEENLGCISLNDELDIVYDKNLFFNNIYEKYNKQFYYNFYLLKEQLKNIFNIDINVVECNYNNTIDFKEIIEQNAISLIEKDDKDINKQIIEKNIKDTELKRFENTDVVQNMFKLVDFNDDIQNNLNICKKDKKFIDEYIKTKQKETLINLNKKELKEFVNIIKANKETDVKEYKIIKNSFYYDSLKKSIKIDVLDEFVEILKKTDKVADLDRFLLNKQYIYVNKLFLEDKNSLLLKSMKEQKIVIEFFIKDDGKSKNRKINDNNINKIKEELNKEFNKEYSDKQIMKLINCCLNYSDNDVVNSLKMK